MSNGVTFERIATSMSEQMLLWLYRSRCHRSSSRERLDWEEDARDMCRSWCMDALMTAHKLDIPINADISRLDPYTVEELFNLEPEFAGKADKLGTAFARRFIDFFNDGPEMPEESVLMTYEAMRASPVPECAWSRPFAFPALRGQERRLFLVRLHEGEVPYDSDIGVDADDCPKTPFPASRDAKAKFGESDWRFEISKMIGGGAAPKTKIGRLNSVASKMAKVVKILSDCLERKGGANPETVSEGLSAGLNEIQIAVFVGLDSAACKAWLASVTKREKGDDALAKTDFVCRTMLAMTDTTSGMLGRDMITLCNSVGHYVSSLSGRMSEAVRSPSGS